MTPNILNNAHKLAYLIQQFPEKKLNDSFKDGKLADYGLLSWFQLPPISLNSMIWAAIELGLIGEPNKETNQAEFLKAPETGWEFGDKVEGLVNEMFYCFEKLNAREQDLEDNYLSNWLMGNVHCDIAVATRRLLENKQLAKYDIEDGENTYTFFTLYENRDKKWGQKQFKKNPLADKKDEK